MNLKLYFEKRSKIINIEKRKEIKNINKNIKTNKSLICFYIKYKSFKDKYENIEVNRKIKKLILQNLNLCKDIERLKPRKEKLKFKKIKNIKSSSYDFTVEKLLHTTDEEKMVEFGFENRKYRN